MSTRIIKTLFSYFFSSVCVIHGALAESSRDNAEDQRDQEPLLVLTRDGIKKCYDYTSCQDDTEPKTNNYENGIKVYTFHFSASLRSKPVNPKTDSHVPASVFGDLAGTSSAASPPAGSQIVHRSKSASSGLTSDRNDKFDYRRPLESALEDAFSFVSSDESINLGPTIAGYGMKVFDATGDAKVGITASHRVAMTRQGVSFFVGFDSVKDGPIVPFVGVGDPLSFFGLNAGVYFHKGKVGLATTAKFGGADYVHEINIDSAKFENIDLDKVSHEVEREIEHSYFGVPSLWQ